MRFSIDDLELGRVTPPNGGFWEFGGFNQHPNVENPWRFGSKMAPFDEQVQTIIYVLINWYKLIVNVLLKCYPNKLYDSHSFVCRNYSINTVFFFFFFGT